MNGEGSPGAPSPQLSLFQPQQPDQAEATNPFAQQGPRFIDITDLVCSGRPSPRHVEQAEKQIKASFKRSAAFIQKYIPLWDLLEDLYYNRRKIDQWAKSRGQCDLGAGPVGASPAARKQNGQPARKGFRSRMTIGVSPFIDKRIERLMEIIFTNKEYFQVRPSPRNNSGSVEDPQYPTADKIQSWLLQSCNDLEFGVACAEFITDGIMLGTAVAKTPWYEEGTQKYLFDTMTGEVVPQPITHRHGTLCDVLNLARFLPDPDAKTSDIQRWRFIGDRSDQEYQAIKSRFGTKQNPGPYNLNRDKFLHEWPDEAATQREVTPARIKDDPNAAIGTAESDSTRLQVWEGHGKLWFDDVSYPVESVYTLITSCNTDDPSGGILVRLEEKPVLKISRRPYLLWQYKPKAQVFGEGEIQKNLDLIWILSNLYNQFLECARVISTAMIKAKATSKFLQEVEENDGDMWWLGKVLTYLSDPNEVEAFVLQVGGMAELLQAIQMCENQLERRTAVPDVAVQRRQTATEFTGLERRAEQPIALMLRLLKEKFLDPFGKIAVAQMQQHVTSVQQVFVKGPKNMPIPVDLTPEEISTGEYIVEAALDLQDQAKISKAQTIMQIMPVMDSQAMPLLLLEDKEYKRSGLIEALAKFLDITDYAKIIEDVTPERKQEILMTLNPPQQAAPPSPEQGQPSPEQEGESPDQGQGDPIQLLLQLASNIPQPSPNGGPAGSEPSALNEILQRLQFDGQANAPVPPGGQYPAG